MGNSASAAPGSPYRVLARKYRPTTFEHLIGQDAMVHTLDNAFATGRIAQAYMLTGVRGIGKTTTARLIARALNYSGPGAPTVHMEKVGDHCAAILESRHPDVIEMDAASRTGVDDIRELIEGVRYRPIDARYKVYIIDEVHMLSKAAFNALLKTLEEPPEHVKFIFATTEVRKVPVTVLSRCQRFDLKRLDVELLIKHFRRVSESEGVTADDEALALISRASEGSVRDGLSLLDQAIAYGLDHVSADTVRSMLGLADRGQTLSLFETVMRGDVPAALGQLKHLYELGAEPVTILGDLAELTHWVTRLKVVPSSAQDPSRSEVERLQGASLADRLSIPVLTRAWQMLLKGTEEVSQASHALAAAEMVIIRMAYVADLPTPREIAEGSVARRPEQKSEPTGHISQPPQSIETRQSTPPNTLASRAAAHSQTILAVAEPVSQPTTVDDGVRLTSFRDIATLAGDKRDLKLKDSLERYVRPVQMRARQLDIALEPGAPQGLANELSRKLEQWTGQRWMVSVTKAGGEKPIAEQDRYRRESLFEEARSHPSVQAFLERFKGAEIVDVKDLSAIDQRLAEDAVDDEIRRGDS
nr:DNA polymerase III subunit gamma/tau [Rhodoligotrophos appendicifer]